MNLIDRVIMGLAPSWGVARARARIAHAALMRYDAAAFSDRTRSLRARPGSADSAAQGQRDRLAHIGRDLVRNTPFATRVQAVIGANVVGDGIIPKVKGGSAASRKALLEAIERHFDTTDVDANGRQNLYGLQRLVMNTVVEAGEALVRIRSRDLSDGFALPFQLEVLEPDFLDRGKDAERPDGSIREGIQYDSLGRRTGYWLFYTHPGDAGWRRRLESRFVPADQILHVYRQDRPGQQRGVSWFAPVALQLQDMADYQEAQLLRQKIAACFTAFRVNLDGAGGTASEADTLGTLVPGRIQNLAPGEDIRFASPPGVTNYDEFSRAVLRAVAAGVGITYEALVGDLSQVNFSSARMGRMEMDRNVSGWQWLLLIPQFLQPIGQRAVRDFAILRGNRAPGLSIEWVPPARLIVDPSREIPAMLEAIEGGIASRQGTVRSLGYDPERLLDEQEQDRIEAERRGLAFSRSGSGRPEADHVAGPA